MCFFSLMNVFTTQAFLVLSSQGQKWHNPYIFPSFKYFCFSHVGQEMWTPTKPLWYIMGLPVTQCQSCVARTGWSHLLLRDAFCTCFCVVWGCSPTKHSPRVRVLLSQGHGSCELESWDRVRHRPLSTVLSGSLNSGPACNGHLCGWRFKM